MTFQELGLLPEILRAVEEQGYKEPTEIQKQAIPTLLKGNDMMGLAPTGTGKTAAFSIPILQSLTNSAPTTQGHRKIRALILTPTRELAAQIAENVRFYGKYLNLKSEVIFGGVNINPQIDKLHRGMDIVIATPGRLLDLINQGYVNLSKIEILVLDEADRMLDMGFIRDINKIIEMLPRKKQSMLFSATLSNDIQRIAKNLLSRVHDVVEVAKRNLTANLVQQIIHPVDRRRKRELLSFMIGSKNWKQVLVFTKTKHGANNLCEQLVEDGLSAAAIHGNKSQGARTRALADFKSGKVRVLVATDIAARGIDIDHLPFVVNFDLPNVPEDYVHRIGRTGRAGNTGVAVSLVCADDRPLLRDIERVIKTTIPQVVVEGYEVDNSINSAPVVKVHRSEPRNNNSGNSNSRYSSGTRDTNTRYSSGSRDGESRRPSTGNSRYGSGSRDSSTGSTNTRYGSGYRDGESRSGSTGNSRYGSGTRDGGARSSSTGNSRYGSSTGSISTRSSSTRDGGSRNSSSVGSRGARNDNSRSSNIRSSDSRGFAGSRDKGSERY